MEAGSDGDTQSEIIITGASRAQEKMSIEMYDPRGTHMFSAKHLDNVFPIHILCYWKGI